MSTLSQDLRYAIRALRTNPGFSVVAILSLAIGIGANTAIFSVASALLLRPLPYANADRQVILWNTSPGLGIMEDWFSTAQYFDIKNGAQSFENVAIAIGANANLTGDGEPERVGTIRVSSNLLPMLGVRPLLGDLFGPDDDRPGTTGKALLGFGTWMRRYGGDRHVVGRALTLNGQPYEVVGVLPASFSLPREVMPTLGVVDDAEVVLPLPLAANAAEVRNREDYNIIATLRPGATLAQARAELDALTARLRREHPDFYPPNGGLTFRVLPLQEQTVGRVRLALLVLVASVAFVLLIACANVANLLLSRALARQQEIAVRAALGASRWRIVRQLLTESMVLAIAAGLVGLLLSYGCLLGIRALGDASVPRLHEIAIDWRVMLYALAISVLAGAIFGLAPALRLANLDLHGSLKDASRGSAGAGAVWGRGQNLRRLLVVAELALSVMLLIGAGLLIRSFSHLQNVSPGFNPANVLTLELTMTGRKYNDADAVLQAYRQLWERLVTLPGVTAAGGVSALPLSQMMAWGPITVEGRTVPEGEKFINADIRVVGGDYFRAMDIPVLRGRTFSKDIDTGTSPRAVVIDERMARQFWPGEDPIGKRIRTGGFDVTPDTPWMTIIGVVGSVKQDALDADSRIAYYRFQGQTPSRAMNVVVRSATDPAILSAAVTGQIRALDPDLPIYKMRTMGERVEASLAERRFSMLLLTLFAVLALGLAAIGIYGVMAYLVTQGTRELGIRVALGATPRDLLLLVLKQGMAVAMTGMALGLLGAFVLTRFMRALLFGVHASDPVTFVAIAAALTGVALVACYLPARRAARSEAKRLLLFAVVFAFLPVMTPGLGAQTRPNIVLIVADDLGYGDLGSYGAVDIKTPNLDRLAREGVRLTDFYANAPVCTPTRAGLMSGRYQQRVRLERPIETNAATPATGLDIGLPATGRSLPQLLKNAGYATGLIGKWHLGFKPEFHPNRHGFDYFWGYLAGYVDWYAHVRGDGQPDLWENATAVRHQGYLDHELTRRAVTFIGDHASRPFFLEVSYGAPHWPFQSPHRGSTAAIRNGSMLQYPSDANPPSRADYAEIVEDLDAGVGRILDALAARGLAEKTLVVFTSDNGGEWLSRNAPFFHRKDTVWEGGIRVPAIARWPAGLPAGKAVTQVGVTMDLSATFVALAGGDPAGAGFEGIDLLPIMRGASPVVERTLFWRVGPGPAQARAVRSGDWKLVVDGAGAKQLLFDVTRDPGERNDLAARHPDRVRRLKAMLDAWEKDVGGAVAPAAR